MYKIHQISKLSGVSVRTLQHYDKIGLLCPQKLENGYRAYNEQDIDRLQSILYYKYLGFPLAQIEELLDKNEGARLLHLQKQLHLLLAEQTRLSSLIDTLQKTIASIERKTKMSNKEKFQGFVYEDNAKYKQTAIDKYGKEAIEASIARQKGKEQEITDGFNQIFFAFADNMEKSMPATAGENVALAEKLHRHLCSYAFDCKLEVFGQIGLGYVQNPEFKENLDKFGEGTAQYVSDAIQAYVNAKQ